MRFVRVSLALHVGVKESRAAGFETNDRIGRAFVRVGRVLVLHMRVRHKQRSEALDDGRILDDRSHRDMRSLNRVYARHTDDALKKLFQRGHVRFEVWQLLVEKHVFRRNHDLGGALAGIDLHTFDNVLERERAPHFRCRPAELAAAAATPRDLNYSKSRTMTNNRNLFDGRLHLFRNLNNPRQARIALHDALEEIAEDALNFAINQIVNLELV